VVHGTLVVVVGGLWLEAGVGVLAGEKQRKVWLPPLKSGRSDQIVTNKGLHYAMLTKVIHNSPSSHYSWCTTLFIV